MSLERFIADRRPGWDELAALVQSGGRSPAGLGASGVLRLAQSYRITVADLALARRLYPTEAVTAELESLVVRSRAVLYGAPTRRAGLVDFITRRYWNHVRSRPTPLLIAAVVLLGISVGVGFWSHANPAEAQALLPAEFAGAAQERSDEGSLGLSGGEQAAFATAIFTNNVRVVIAAFAGGISLGLLTLASLAFNGVVFGVIAGLGIEAGNAERLFELVAPHGVLEISLIIVGGAAGLRLGWSLVEPGVTRTRLEALVEEGRATIEVALGTAVWLVIAGLIEGFVTPRGLGLTWALVFGIGVGVTFWGLVFTLGRPQGIE